MHKDILVIDDNPDIRFLICNILKEKKFNVRSAANYDQAILEINKKMPDLSIVDIKLDKTCLLYTSPSPRDATLSRMPSSA